MTSEEVPYSQLLYALNGTLVALIGDNVDNISDCYYFQDNVDDNEEVDSNDYSMMMIENQGEHDHKKKIVSNYKYK